MIDHSVEIIRICVVLQILRQSRIICLIHRNCQLWNTSIDQFHPAEFTDVGFDHHGIHTPDLPADPHQFGNGSAQVIYAVMVKILVMKCFVIIAPPAETAQCLVAQRLLFETRCVQGILEPEIQHKIFNHFIIRIIKKLFDNECTNDYIYRSIRSGCLITV